jgi:hypothetical protein
LDALRAATEPVKVEAMQAIVMFGVVVGCVVCAGGMAHRGRSFVLFSVDFRKSLKKVLIRPGKLREITRCGHAQWKRQTRRFFEKRYDA